ncbi:MAG: hypothetical protein WD689_01615 [Gaiellaceae bacterium]
MRALAVILLALVAAGSAEAHEVGQFHQGFVSTVSGVEPPLPGLLVDIYNGHELLTVRNFTQKTVRFPGADIVLTPGLAASWREPQIAPAGPPQREGLVRRWRIPGTADGEPFAIVGFLGYSGPLPPDEGLPAWVIVLAGAAGALGLGAALALPLLRRKGEDGAPTSATEP